MVESETRAPACGLSVFSTVGVTATSGEFKVAFRDKCETVYSEGVCTGAISELWDGQDISAQLTSPTSEFCVRLRRVVDAAQRSALAGQDVGFTGLNVAMSRKVKTATDEDLSDEKPDGGESGVGARFEPWPSFCVEDDFEKVCVTPGLNRCHVGVQPRGPKSCKRDGRKLVEQKTGVRDAVFTKQRWPRRPPGCSVRGSRVFWNLNGNGRNKGSFDLLCISPKDPELTR